MGGESNSYFITKWQSQIKKGLLEYIIMQILKDKPFYGYELISEIKHITSLDIAEGTIYPLLNRLKKEELVFSEWIEMETGIPRKYYKITEKGLGNLMSMQKYVNQLFGSLSIIEKTRK
ncbi:MAG: PadR family transcriptional regulator [Bacteroidales bacterium]